MDTDGSVAESLPQRPERVVDCFGRVGDLLAGPYGGHDVVGAQDLPRLVKQDAQQGRLLAAQDDCPTADPKEEIVELHNCAPRVVLRKQRVDPVEELFRPGGQPHPILERSAACGRRGAGLDEIQTWRRCSAKRSCRIGLNGRPPSKLDAKVLRAIEN
jgi:hypothetical protein